MSKAINRLSQAIKLNMYLYQHCGSYWNNRFTFLHGEALYIEDGLTIPGKHQPVHSSHTIYTKDFKVNNDCTQKLSQT